MAGVEPCAELQQLKQQYEFALRAWGSYEFPLRNEPVGTLTRRFERIELKERALDARNAARKLLLDHQAALSTLC
jgi:hypothetical protein